MKCYNILFSSKGLLFNIGSYILLAIIFLIKKGIKKTNKNKKNNSDIKEPPKKFKNKTKNNDDSKAIKLNISEFKV